MKTSLNHFQILEDNQEKDIEKKTADQNGLRKMSQTDKGIFKSLNVQ